MNWGALLIVVVYLAITLFIPMYAGKKNTVTNDDYTVGGRKFGTLFLFFTLLSTVVGAASVVGYTGWYYVRGMSQLWFILGIALSYCIYIFYLAPRINDFGFKHGGETVGDWIAYRYGKASRILTSIIIMIGYLAITAFQYMAMATIFVKITGLSFTVSLIITAIIVILHTSYGGLWAVASNNVLQGSITLFGLLILATFLIMHAGGLGAVFASAPAEHFQAFGYFTPGAAISSTLVFLLGIISWPDMWQQCYAAKDQKTLKKSMVLFLVALILLCGVIMLVIGFTALSLYPNYETPESILPFMIMDQFNVVVGALFLSVLLAVILGGADTLLLVSSMILHKDLYNSVRPNASEQENLRASKLSALLCGVVVLVLAIIAPSMFDLWVMSADLMGATLAVPILLGFAWKRPSSVAGFASIIAGLLGWVLAYTGAVPGDGIVLGAGFSLVAYLIAAFVKPNTKELPDSNQESTKEAGAI
ncbi:sodium:solute symporter family protein [Candidatus Formimonas warabiya]|uniref:Sodium:solute symporter n=1 Tax=Formimonas warabiya TaxID=1761012 RepID=A0A3G1KYX2_FORW1|nr:sodium:solute symporter family protein [Candidatus Formimonas warabiya]ATW27696.1 sodium:solute symporter [Candidatus Formimonas warabiya]